MSVGSAQGEPCTAARGVGSIRIDRVDKTFTSGYRRHAVQALQNVSLEIAPREFISIVGSSGCGKSTLLKIVAGLVQPSAGRTLVDDLPVEGPRRSIGMMFQTPELFPWRNTLENTFLPIDLLGQDRRAHLRRAQELLHKVGLAGFEGAYPRELSGGMQQRVALSRTLMADPTILLMDEPFGALDELTREKMNLELLRIWDEAKKTVVFVTHNIGEAVFLSDRVVVMGTGPGRVLATIPVPLPRPRAIDCLKEAAFVETAFAIRACLGAAR